MASQFVQKNHPKYLILGDKNTWAHTRSRLASGSEHAKFFLLSKIEPNKFREANGDKHWIDAT